MICRILFVSILFFYRVDSVLVKNCGSYFNFADVSFEGCESTADSCNISVGFNSTISFSMDTGTFDITSPLRNQVSVVVRGFTFDLPVTPSDPCLVLSCPLPLNYTASFSANIYVDSAFPPVAGDLEWLMETADLSEQLLCFSFPVTIS